MLVERLCLTKVYQEIFKINVSFSFTIIALFEGHGQTKTDEAYKKEAAFVGRYNPETSCFSN